MRADETKTPPNNYHSMNAQELALHRDEEHARQEEMLDEIHRGVKGLKNQAGAINDEVVSQNAMIDDINNRVDGAQRDLEIGEAKAREVNEKRGKVCKLYGVIAVLVVAEVALSIANIAFF